MFRRQRRGLRVSQARRRGHRVFAAPLILISSLFVAVASASGAAWPGGSSVSFADDVNVFGGNLSGLAYQPSGTKATGVLWAVRNGPSTLFRLVFDGTRWVPDTTGGWAAGKPLHYSGGIGSPDAEGVALADSDPDGIYVSTERDNDNSNTSRPAVLRYDISSAASSLSATDDFNLTADLPGLGANAGLEAVTWIPDEFLIAKGFRDDSTGGSYDPANYPDHGAGLFFVGVESDGRIIAYAFNHQTGAFSSVATVASSFPSVMELHYEAESGNLWAVCDNTCSGRSATLAIAQSGPDAGHFVVGHTYERPAGLANLNNEGFAIVSQAECSNGLKPVFWADDGNTDMHALRVGSLNCANPHVTDPLELPPTSVESPQGSSPTPVGSPQRPSSESVVPLPIPPVKAAFSTQTLVKLALPAGRVTARRSLGVLVANANGFEVSGTLSARSVGRSESGSRRLKLKNTAFSVPAKARKIVSLKLSRSQRGLLKRQRTSRLQLVAKVSAPTGEARTVSRRVTVQAR